MTKRAQDTLGEPVADRPGRGPKDYGRLGVKGFAMGAADVVPGVSGGTMALILGIYEELILSIRAAGRPEFVRALLRFDLRRAFELVNGRFLLSVLTGIAAAVLSLARGLEWLVHNEPVLLWSFFFGLIAASVLVVGRRIRRWSLIKGLAFITGAVAAFVVVGLTPAETPETFWFLFLSGALAVCALILPGISGAFILLLLGKYELVLSAVTQGNLPVILNLGLGGVLGLISFAHVLGWLLRRYHDPVIAVLCGFMLGSLRKIWPWKEVTPGPLPAEFARNAWPELVVQGSFNTEVLYAALLAALGFTLVMLIDRLERRQP